MALLAAWIGVAVCVHPASSEPPAVSHPSRAASVWHYVRDTPRLLDDPGGLRGRLEQLGVTLQLFFQTFVGAHVRGGSRSSGRVRDSGSYDLFALADLEELGILPGNDIFLQVKGNYGRNVNPFVGALSDPVDDADFDEGIWVAQLWSEQLLLHDRVRIRVGYLDQQTVLDRNAFANSEDRQFMSTFLDNNPVVPLRIGLGAALFVDPFDWLELVVATADADNPPRRAGFDTAFDGASSLMAYFEARARYRLTGPDGVLPGSLRIGAFRDGSRKEVFGSVGAGGGPKRERGHAGTYLNLDQLVYREDPEDPQGLGLFARYGYADPDVNRIEHFWSVGLHYEGLVPGRDRDVLGLAAYQAIGSDRYRDEIESDFHEETGFELYYKIALAPWLAVTPDVQLILDPGGLRSARDAVIVLLRFRATF